MRHSIAAVMLAAALTATATAEAAAQTPDVSGTWTLSVTTDQGTTTPTVTLVQDGQALTGQYRSDTLGEADVEGSVSGSSVTWSFEASAQGQALPVVYRGTLAADGTMSGTIDIAGGMLTGSFTGRRGGD